MTFLNFTLSFLNFLRLFLNHLINIPLTLLSGINKIYVILIAFSLDVIQSFIYTKILEGTKITSHFPILLKIFPQEQTIENKPFFSKFKKLQYFGIFLLASLPVYTGGICAAATLRYISKNLNPKKSLIIMYLGSLTGCIIWVLGVNILFESIKFIFKILFL